MSSLWDQSSRLSPATLAVVAVNDGLPLGSTFLYIVTYVIILTNVVTTAGSFWISRKMKNSETKARVVLGKESSP
jgi:hypothetical protein